MIVGVRGALAKTINKIEPHYPFMGEMLADDDEFVNKFVKKEFYLT